MLHCVCVCVCVFFFAQVLMRCLPLRRCGLPGECCSLPAQSQAAFAELSTSRT